ncbi:hypothetical protein CDAR_464421 [Caerostris darwini]|uniref:Uncharacterized protein n=1 Tax=Caerostris darwini TaxID=1538125 RepID=A0AAV4VWV8_9ARAC|nr:hypothetical protein CDAR_464421 [Caerostris darwini]
MPLSTRAFQIPAGVDESSGIHPPGHVRKGVYLDPGAPKTSPSAHCGSPHESRKPIEPSDCALLLIMTFTWFSKEASCMEMGCIKIQASIVLPKWSRALLLIDVHIRDT